MRCTTRTLYTRGSVVCGVAGAGGAARREARTVLLMSVGAAPSGAAPSGAAPSGARVGRSPTPI